MDIYLLKLVVDWFSVLIISLISFFGVGTYSEKNLDIENTSYTNTATVVNEIVPYKTEYVFNPNKSADSEALVLIEGENGINYAYANGEVRVLKNPVNKVVELGTAKRTEYTGRLTYYGADCPGCSKTGTVACSTREGKRFSLYTDGIYYNDYMYGDVRIVAADFRGFPCGTIVLVDNGLADPFLAVVLDTGYTMRKSYDVGYVWMDLAFSYAADGHDTNSNSKNTKFSVQRWGW